MRRLAVRALTKAGWTVLSADSGEAALALLAERGAGSALCAIVSDVVMPGMDGVALVRAVRGRHPSVPAILVSGYAEETVRDDLGAEGIAFMPKPYKLKALVEALEQVAVVERRQLSESRAIDNPAL